MANPRDGRGWTLRAAVAVGALVGAPLLGLAADGPLLSRGSTTTTPATASVRATPASTNSSTLKWRRRSTQATTVSIESKHGVKRTQLLDKLPEEEAAGSEAAPAEGPQLQWKNDLRRISQPDPDQPIDDSQRRQQEMTELDRALAPRQREEKECPERDDKRIYEITTKLQPEEGDLPHYCPLGDEVFVPRHWAGLTYTWKASGLCHKPLYFEEVALERYGHTWGYLQPVVSGVHFFGTLPILPYKMGVEAPWECIYALGYYEPGSCAPYIVYPVPLNVRGALLEAGAWTGGVLLIP